MTELLLLILLTLCAFVVRHVHEKKTVVPRHRSVIISIGIDVAFAIVIAIDVAISVAIAVIATNVAISIAVSFIILSSLEDQARVLYFIAIGIMKIHFINRQVIKDTVATAIAIRLTVIGVLYASKVLKLTSRSMNMNFLPQSIVLNWHDPLCFTAIAFATAIAIKNDYLAIVVAFAIAFVIPLQSETALSSLTHSGPCGGFLFCARIIARDELWFK